MVIVEVIDFFSLATRRRHARQRGAIRIHVLRKALPEQD